MSSPTPPSPRSRAAQTAQQRRRGRDARRAARAGGAKCANASGSHDRSAIVSIIARAVDVADAGHQHENAVPAHLVARILEHAQEREHVLDVRGLEELEAAPLLERDLAVRELDLEVGRHVGGAHEHRHLAQRHALLVQLEHAIDDEARLLLLVARRDEPGRLRRRCARVQRFFGEALERARDERVRRVEDRLRRAVVLLERDDLRSRELLREVENVAEAGAAERIDALRVVADDGDVAVRAAHPAEDARLEKVRVLVLVDENVVVQSGDAVGERRATARASAPRRAAGRRSRRDCAPPFRLTYSAKMRIDARHRELEELRVLALEQRLDRDVRC